MALLNFTSGIRLRKSINSSRGEWAQQYHVLPSTYKGGDAEFVVTNQQASCLVATKPQTVWSLCSGVIPGSVMLTPHSTQRIYNRVAITHLLHRVSQTRTYYNKYGLMPSNNDNIGRLGRLVSPSTPTTSLSIEPRPKGTLIVSEKSATWTLQPEMGQHMEYAGKVTHRE